ncbi:MAG: hypothetical protein Q4D91_12845 [Lautropia sp.]|nr:hypothetical protein [Lautropia sp.]
MMTDVLVSNVPGRIRLRGARLRVPHGLESVQRRLQVLPGVVSVQTNARVGSLLMRYDPVRLPPEAAVLRLTDMLDSILPVSVGVQASAEEGMAVKAPGEADHGRSASRRPESPAAAEWKGWWALREEASASVGAKAASRSLPLAASPASVKKAENLPAQGRMGAKAGMGANGGEAAKDAQGGKATEGCKQATPNRNPSRLGKINWRKRVNQVAKQGMLLSLGSSLGLAAAGSKKGHIVTGSAFVGLLGVHLAVHRKSLFK